MSGVKGRSGRRPADNRKNFNEFATGNEVDKDGVVRPRIAMWWHIMHEKAMDGDRKAAEYLIDQAVGRAPQNVEVTTPEDDPLLLALRQVQAVVQGVTVEELEQLDSPDTIEGEVLSAETEEAPI